MPALKHMAALLALSSLAACASTQPSRPDVSPWPEIRPDFRVAALRLRMHEYAITFAAQVDLAATGIERRATDSTIQRNALLWRIRAVPEMRKACFRLEPVAALVDAWILARQMHQLFSEGAATNAFGTFQPEAVEISRGLVRQMREIGGSIAVSPEAAAEFEHRFVDPWVAEHPLRDVSFVRESPIARFADQSRASGDIFQSVGTMEYYGLGADSHKDDRTRYQLNTASATGVPTCSTTRSRPVPPFAARWAARSSSTARCR